MTTGGVSSRAHRASRHGACHQAAARSAMEAARRALDEPGLLPGDEAWAEHEQLRLRDSAVDAAQGELPFEAAP